MHFNGNDVFTGINEPGGMVIKTVSSLSLEVAWKKYQNCVSSGWLTTNNSNPVNVNQGSVIIDNPEEITFT